MDGKYIKVIIGSKVISEGITFKNIQNIHIFTPSWNFSETDQAIARGYRLFSHRDLEEAGKDVNVKIFLYCAIPMLEEEKYDEDGERSLEGSIDYQMYKVNNDKDISIKSIEKVIKEASIDCALNKKRNTFPGSSDGSRECNYGSCKYKCDGVSDDLIDNLGDDEIDVSTYNLYYNENDLNEIITDIKKLFDEYAMVTITFQKLFQSIKKEKYTYRMMIDAIGKMVSNNITMDSVFGNRVFFRFDNDMLYLTSNLKNNSNFFDSYYVERFPLQKEIILNDNIDDFYYNSLPNLFKSLKEETDDTKRRSILRKFPPSVHEFLLETSILSQERGISGINSIREFILNEFRPFIERFEEDKLIASTLLHSIDPNEKIRCLDISDIKEEGEWRDCPDENVDRVIQRLSQKKIEIHDNPYGYYGILNKANDKFSIANIVAEKEKVRLTKAGNVDTRRSSTGRVCTTWDHEELLLLIDNIKLGYPEDFKKRYSKKTDEQMNMEYDNKLFAKITKIVDRDRFEEMSRDDKLRLMYWGISGKDKINKPDICDAIERWFKDNGLLEEKLAEQKNIKKKK